MKQNLLLVVITVLLTLTALEIAARVYQSVRNRTIEDTLFHPVYRHYYFLGPSFKPNSGGDWQAVPEMRINRFGFRGDDFDLRKPAGTFRVVCLGASTTHSGNYPEKLESILAHRLDGYDRVEVINVAVPRWSSTQSIIQYVTRATYLDPDLFIVYHAINDRAITDDHWLHHLMEVDYAQYGGLRMHSQLYAFLDRRVSNYFDERRLMRANTAAREPRFAPEETGGVIGNPYGTSTQVFERNMRNFVAISRANGSRIMLVTMALNYDAGSSHEENLRRAGPAYYDYRHLHERVGQFNTVIRDIAREQDVLYVDAAAAGLHEDPTNFLDFCHFTEAGAGRFAFLLADSIVARFGETLRQRGADVEARAY